MSTARSASATVRKPLDKEPSEEANWLKEDREKTVKVCRNYAKDLSDCRK